MKLINFSFNTITQLLHAETFLNKEFSPHIRAMSHLSKKILSVKSINSDTFDQKIIETIISLGGTIVE